MVPTFIFDDTIQFSLTMAPKRTREEQYVYDLAKQAYQDDEFDEFLAEIMANIYPPQVTKKSKAGDKGECRDTSGTVPGDLPGPRNNGDDDSQSSSSSE